MLDGLSEWTWRANGAGLVLRKAVGWSHEWNDATQC